MSSDSVPVIRARGLGKRYQIGRTGGLFRYRSLREDLARGVKRRLGREPSDGNDRELWALRHADLDIAPGETVGLIGRNGAGKSTLLKLLSGITPPSEGRAEIAGRVGSLLEVGTGFHPELTGRENIFLSGAVLGMRRREIERKVDEIVDFAGVDRFLDTPVKRYSSGMYLRLAFSVAAHLEPDILLVDEVLAVGDLNFQKKCIGRMTEIGESGRTVIFVSHSMPAILRLCERVVLLDQGQVVADGPASEVVRTYLDAGLGSTAEREWPSIDDAPGDHVARLRAVRVRNDRDEVTEEIDITRPFSVEVEYWNLGGDLGLRPSVAVRFENDDGVCLFVSRDLVSREWAATPRQPGLVRARCQVPGNLLAEGTLHVLVAVQSFANTYINHAVEADAVAFQVVDRNDGTSTRGETGHEWAGVIRPALEWTVETDSDPMLGRPAAEAAEAAEAAG